MWSYVWQSQHWWQRAEVNKKRQEQLESKHGSSSLRLQLKQFVFRCLVLAYKLSKQTIIYFLILCNFHNLNIKVHDTSGEFLIQTIIYWTSLLLCWSPWLNGFLACNVWYCVYIQPKPWENRICNVLLWLFFYLITNGIYRLIAL
jgi:hypothetical protein